MLTSGGRGNVGYREIDGPPGAGTVVLLHGWGVTADLNFGAIYADLATRWRVAAPDQRGHGRLRRCGGQAFTLEACAEDAASLIAELSPGPALVLGYSMGGPVGMLLARRHPELVAGLVLVATAANFAHLPGERSALGVLGVAGGVARRLPEALRTAGHRLPDVTCILQAGGALGRFHAEGWLGHLSVPSAVVITAGDHVVPPADQHRLAAAIPGALSLVVTGDHDLCLRHPRRFATTAIRALCRVDSSCQPASGQVA